MRVAVFTGFFLPHLGGVENYIWEVYRRLPDVKVTIVTVNTEHVQTEERVENLYIIRLPGWNVVGRSFPVPKPSLLTFRLLRVLWKERFDVVNTHTRFFPTSFLGLLFAKTKRIPLLHTEHGSDYVRHGNTFVEWVARLYDCLVGVLIIRFADTVIGVSRASAAFAERLGARRLASFVYNGVDVARFRRRRTNLKRTLGIPADSPIVTYVGRLMRAKGPDLLVRAFSKIGRTSKAHLLVIGGGPLLDELKRSARGRRTIHVLGPQDRSRIPDLLSISDVFVLPTTTHPEGLPTSVLEAGACGCAVVATDVGGTREVIQDNETGLLIPPNEIDLHRSLEKLLEFSTLRRRLASNLHQRVIQDFNWEVLAPRFFQQLRVTHDQKVRSN